MKKYRKGKGKKTQTFLTNFFTLLFRRNRKLAPAFDQISEESFPSTTFPVFSHPLPPLRSRSLYPPLWHHRSASFWPLRPLAGHQATQLRSKQINRSNSAIKKYAAHHSKHNHSNSSSCDSHAPAAIGVIFPTTTTTIASMLTPTGRRFDVKAV